MGLWLTDLPQVLRGAGLDVEVVDGFERRGHGSFTSIETLAVHHTAGPKTGDLPSLGVLIRGHPWLAGPLSQLGLGRSGKWWVIAAGVGYHAGVVLSRDYDNWRCLGIEAEGTGVDSWPRVQYDSYALGSRALCDAYGIQMPERVLGHKEICKPRGRKSDPNFDMPTFRRAVAVATPKDWFDMANVTDLKAAVREELAAMTVPIFNDAGEVEEIRFRRWCRMVEEEQDRLKRHAVQQTALLEAIAAKLEVNTDEVLERFAARHAEAQERG